jgi:hypothetical protein
VIARRFNIAIANYAAAVTSGTKQSGSRDG